MRGVGSDQNAGQCFIGDLAVSSKRRLAAHF